MFSVPQSIEVIRERIPSFPQQVIVLGSGWNKVLENATIETEISYTDLFGISSSVPGHQGKLVVAVLGNKRVACMSGRFHTYEGYTSEEVTRPIQVFAAVGAQEVVITAAVGALNETYEVGEFVILNDMITLLCQSPLTGAKFIDMSQAFDSDLRARAKKVCQEQSIPFHEGIYIFTRGPHFESPADKRMMQKLGADVVGMSTVPETIMANACGIKVLGLSFVTNLAFVKHEHKDVLAAAEAGSKQMVTLLTKFIQGAPDA
jgi:inosine/guanosine/xanthosine phosphorylase family protein